MAPDLLIPPRKSLHVRKAFFLRLRAVEVVLTVICFALEESYDLVLSRHWIVRLVCSPLEAVPFYAVYCDP